MIQLFLAHFMTRVNDSEMDIKKLINETLLNVINKEKNAQLFIYFVVSVDGIFETPCVIVAAC